MQKSGKRVRNTVESWLWEDRQDRIQQCDDRRQRAEVGAIEQTRNHPVQFPSRFPLAHGHDVDSAPS